MWQQTRGKPGEKEENEIHADTCRRQDGVHSIRSGGGAPKARWHWCGCVHK